MQMTIAELKTMFDFIVLLSEDRSAIGTASP
jgi:hypothetical protein